jgi:hypothetical protein
MLNFHRDLFDLEKEEKRIGRNLLLLLFSISFDIQSRER